MVSGARPPVRSSHVEDSDVENDDPLMRDTSAASVRSAPVILQRPSSRGGVGFCIRSHSIAWLMRRTYDQYLAS